MIEQRAAKPQLGLPGNRLVWMVKHNILTITRDLLINRVAGSVLLPYPLRWAIYRAYGIQANTLNIKSGCWFTGSDVYIGRGAFINHRVTFDALGGIEIAENCRIAMDVLLVTSSHELGGAEQRAGATTAAPIRIGRGSWLGARVTVLPGVTIGSGCVIAAGSVVTKDCEPNGLYMGIPAHRVRELS
jgi:maltose O-acetyltransferase